jgi:hypothetical protein
MKERRHCVLFTALTPEYINKKNYAMKKLFFASLAECPNSKN